MIKDKEYYQKFDLNAARIHIAKHGKERGNDEIFGDAIAAIAFTCEENPIYGHRIIEVLGEPDRVRKNDAGEVWEYDWSDTYGSINYRSSTPFQITNGMCVRLASRK